MVRGRVPVRIKGRALPLWPPIIHDERILRLITGSFINRKHQGLFGRGRYGSIRMVSGDIFKIVSRVGNAQGLVSKGVKNEWASQQDGDKVVGKNEK